MTNNKFYIQRPVLISKITGFIIGVIFAISMQWISHVPIVVVVGIILWHATIGYIIGTDSIAINHYGSQWFNIPSWLKPIVLGAWMNFVMVLLSYNQISLIFRSSFLLRNCSPLIIVFEGALTGLVMSFVSNKMAEKRKSISKGKTRI